MSSNPCIYLHLLRRWRPSSGRLRLRALYGYRPKSVTAGLDCGLWLYAGFDCDHSAAEMAYAAIVALHKYLFTLKELDERLCKLEKFMFYTSSDTSIWICVVFTVDRFVAVCFPLQHRHSYFSASVAKYYALAASLTAVVKNLHVLWTRGAEYRLVDDDDAQLELVSNCGRPTLEYRQFEFYVRPWIAFAVVFVVPFCILVIISTQNSYA